MGQSVTMNLSKCGDIYDKRLSSSPDVCKAIFDVTNLNADSFWQKVVYDPDSACISTEDARINAYKDPGRLFTEGMKYSHYKVKIYYGKSLIWHLKL